MQTNIIEVKNLQLNMNDKAIKICKKLLKN